MRAAHKLALSGPGICTDTRDFPGLLHDRDVLAYYGDPALIARMDNRPCAYDQKLTKDGDVYTLTVTGNRGEKTFTPVNTNGSQRGGRPVIVFLSERIDGADVLVGKKHHPIIADDFILVPNPGKGESLTIKFRARELK